MRIIELLNKIANNEEVPKKIKVSCYEFEWREKGRYYANTTKGKFQSLVQDWLNNASKLNSEVKIIKDEEKINIQEIELAGLKSFVDADGKIDNVNLAYKYNELLLAVKQLDKNIKELR